MKGAYLKAYIGWKKNKNHLWFLKLVLLLLKGQLILTITVTKMKIIIEKERATKSKAQNQDFREHWMETNVKSNI